MRIKGRYVCTVEFDFDFIHQKIYSPFAEMREQVVNGGLTDAIKDVLRSDIMDYSFGTMTVTQQYADLYEVQEEQE